VIARGSLVACAAVDVVTARASGQRELAFDVLSGGRELADKLAAAERVTEIVARNERTVRVLYAGTDRDQARLVQELVLAGHPLLGIREVGGSLEDLFLRLTDSGEAEASASNATTQGV